MFRIFTHFFAGVLTTRRTMLSLIAIFANHLDIQEKIHKEIDSVIGHNKPRLQDRSEMHYTSAVRKFATSLTNGQLYNFQHFDRRERKHSLLETLTVDKYIFFSIHQKHVHHNFSVSWSTQDMSLFFPCWFIRLRKRGNWDLIVCLKEVR